MINFRRVKVLRRKSLLGKLLRIPFDLIPAKSIIPIQRGPLKNKKWIKGSHNVSILLGIYESKQTQVFIKFAQNTNTFWDLGCHAGYYSLLYNSASPTGKIFAFEPLQETVNIYKRHMSLNKINNSIVFPVAVSDNNGFFKFKKTSSSVAGKLDDFGEITVKVIKLSEFVSEQNITDPDIIKMDIEGAEVVVLNDLKLLLKRKMPSLFISTHGAKLHHDSIALLEEIGYHLSPLDSNDIQTCKEFVAYDANSKDKSNLH